MKTAVTQRELGYTEAACALAHERFAGWGQPVRAAEFTGPLSAEIVLRVLCEMQARHPLLRARLVGHDAGYRFVIDSPPLAVRVLARPDSPSYHAFEEAEHVAPIDPAGPLWRATVLLDGVPERGHHVLIYSSHHAISDGLSACRFVEEFLRDCAAAADGVAIEDSPRPLPPAIEQRLPRSPTWAEYAATLQQAATGRPAMDPWPYAEVSPVDARIPRVVPFAAIAVGPLRTRAAQAGVSVNAALAAAMLQTAAVLAGGRLATTFTTSVNLRSRVVPPRALADVDCCMINVHTGHTVDPDVRFWALARAYADELSVQLPGQSATPAAFDFNALSQRIDAGMMARMTGFPLRLGLSNCGLYPFPTRHGAFTLEHLHFHTSRRAGAYVGFLHAVTVGESLNLCFSYAEPLVAGAWVQAFVAGVVQALAGASAGE
jgi:hypothetical protein